MRILFDGWWWTSGPPSSRDLQRELVHAWHRSFPNDRIAVAIRGSAREPELPVGVERVSTHLRPHALSNTFELRRIARRWRADAVIADSFTPARSGAVTFVHDAMFLDHPDWYSWQQRLNLRAVLPSARLAAVVATGTASEAARIERHAWELAPVTALGTAPRTALTAVPPERPGVTTGLEGFALAVGRWGARSDHDRLAAAARQSARISARTPLIIAVSSEERRLRALRRLESEAPARIVAGLRGAELSWLYRHAAVALALERDENYGLAALEATWFDTPLVATDLPAHRETAGGWARMVPVDAPPSLIAAVIDDAWNAPGDESARTRIIERSSWPHVVRALRTALPHA